MQDVLLDKWVNASCPAIHSPAKQHEFQLYIPPTLALLESMGARDIVDFQADEGEMSVAFCAQNHGNQATFVLPPAEADPQGVFRAMAAHITGELQDQERIHIVASSAEIPDSSADAILFNNILGCQGTLENVESVIMEAERVLKPGGHAIVTMPNPLGGMFSSYRCSGLTEEDSHGACYKFQMRGEETQFVNLHLTRRGRADTFALHGFGEPLKSIIRDHAYEGLVNIKKPAFFQYVFQKIPEPV